MFKIQNLYLQPLSPPWASHIQPSKGHPKPNTTKYKDTTLPHNLISSCSNISINWLHLVAHLMKLVIQMGIKYFILHPNGSQIHPSPLHLYIFVLVQYLVIFHPTFIF